MRSLSGSALSLVLGVAMVAVVPAPALSSAAPTATTTSRTAPCSPTLGSDGELVTNVVVLGGNGPRGRSRTAAVAGTLRGGHSWIHVSADRAVHRTLTPSRLESAERRGQRASYFARSKSRAGALVRQLRERARSCPGQAQGLVGYSQGALAVRLALHGLDRSTAGRKVLDTVASVVLVGDPAASRRDHVTRFGARRPTGVVRGRLPLPATLTSRGLVSSWCATADPVCHSTKKMRRGHRSAASTRKLVRGHLSYQSQGAGSALSGHVLGLLDPAYSWTFASPSRFAGSPRTGDPFEYVAAAPSTFRVDRDATILPAGVVVGDDLSISGTAPVPDPGDDLIIGFTDAHVAPAVLRVRHLSLDTWPRSIARPGVRAITHGAGGAPANGPSSLPTISADGEHVAFVSAATNLVATDTNGELLDVFSWDRISDTFRRLEVGATIDRPYPSADGRYVAFVTTDPVVPADTDQLADAFVWDAVAGTVQLASPNAAASVSGVSMSADGATVWSREAARVTAFDRAGATTAVVPSPAGTTWAPGHGAAWIASGDGRYVVTSDTGYAIYDRTTATSSARCVSGQGTAALMVSDDGQLLAAQDARNSERDPSSYPVMCRPDGTRLPNSTSISDLSADATTWLSGWSALSPPYTTEATTMAVGADWMWTRKWLGTRESGNVLPTDSPSSLSADGATAVFTEIASNIVETAPVLWGQPDIYLWDRTVSP